jgi:hypothetical protein
MRAVRDRRNGISLDPHIAMIMVLASTAAWLMTQAGLAKNALELRRKRRACPSCGSHDGCGCNT